MSSSVLEKITERISDVVFGSRLAQPTAPHLMRGVQWMYERGVGRGAVPYPLARRHFGDATLVRLDPSRINRHVQKFIQAGGSPVGSRRFFVLGGDWDLNAEPFDEFSVSVEMRSLVRHHPDYRASSAYRRRIAEMERGEARRHRGIDLDSAQRIEEYFERYCRLVDSMRTQGYRSQKELGGPDEEIGVAIGREGELMSIRKGHHRLAIARLLKLESVVASVRLVHATWLRDRTREHGLAPATALCTALRGIETAAPGSPA